ncbi:hypothetical protein [Lacticaseibacillus hulanensis]|uniref:hypothetical protein n=1 Tax=Lacticaseibacillus hulanensis TaxID=2493111 RepID=UPI000FDC8CA0|nr:hypothetical protein [Lacticaseibacillus hulanensis]
MPQVTSRRNARRKSATSSSYGYSKKRPQYRVQRWFATFFLVLVATMGIGIFGAKQTILSSDFTTKTLTSGDNLNSITTQVQKNVGGSLTNIPGATTLVSRAISTATAKSVVTTAVADVYTNTTNQIDFTAMDNAVKDAFSTGTSGLSATLAATLATSVLDTLHSYFNNQLATRTTAARTYYQDASSAVKSLTIPLVVIGALCAIWLLIVAGFARFLHNLGWASMFAGLLGLGVLQLGQNLPMVTSQIDKFGDFQLVAADYLAQVVNHMSGYYIIAAVAGLVVLVITIPFIRAKR